MNKENPSSSRPIKGSFLCLPPRRAGSPGFTLIELLIVIAILGGLASLGIPAFQTYIEKARVARATAEIRVIEGEILSYRIGNGKFPDSLAQIGWGGRPDPWGNPYQYRDNSSGRGNGMARKNYFMRPLNSDFDLYSMGKDGATTSPLTAKASRDDVIRANNGQYVGPVEKY
jgi:general secretion pathway protein G